MIHVPGWGAAQKLTDDPHVNLFAAEAPGPTGTRRWTFASRKPSPGAGGQADAAVIVAVIRGPEPRLVLTREYRVPLRAFELSVPSGLIDPGESVIEAARRELKEETGLLLGRVFHVSPPLASSAGLTDETVSLVYAEASGTVSTVDQTTHESIEVRLADIHELRGLLESPGPDVISSRVYPILLAFVSSGDVRLPLLA